MKITHALVAAWLAMAGSAAAAPVEAYGALPTMEDVAISPDGSKLAYVAESKGERFIVVQDVAGHLLAAIKIDDQKVRGVQWGDETHVLITHSTTMRPEYFTGSRSEMFSAWVFDLESRRQTDLMARAEDMSLNAILDPPIRRMVDGRPTMFVPGANYSDNGKIALYAIDVEGGRTQTMKTAPWGTDGFAVDPSGHVVAQTGYDENSRHWSLRMHIGNAWTEVYGEDVAIDEPYLRGFSADGTALLVTSRKGGERRLMAFQLSDGASVTPPFPRLAYGVVDPLTGRVIGERTIAHDVSYRFFDARNQQVWTSVAAHFSGEQVELESASDDRARMVVHVTGRDDGDAYFLVDTAAGKISLIGPVRRGIVPQDIARVTQFVYAAADGRQLDAYLTLPSSRDARNLPLIVLPHGGPASRDNPGFDWWAQALAAQGYAVLQPQFRGSEGFGWDLLSAGFGEWGRKMQTDLSDGVGALVRSGIVDPTRVCIVGGSYGGYAALAGATLQKGIYRCAVSVAGVADPGSLVAWSNDRRRRSDNQENRYWMRFMGAANPADPALDAISPLKQVANATIPILLIHGKDDTVVPIEQSQAMFAALKKGGSRVQFVTLEGEDHWLSRSKTRLEMLTATVEFLKANNPP